MDHEEVFVARRFRQRRDGELLTALCATRRVIAGDIGLLATERTRYEGDEPTLTEALYRGLILRAVVNAAKFSAILSSIHSIGDEYRVGYVFAYSRVRVTWEPLRPT